MPGVDQVPSMTDGGMLWFTDLTVADPYYALPIASSAVFLLTVELGAADGMQATTLSIHASLHADSTYDLLRLQC